MIKPDRAGLTAADVRPAAERRASITVILFGALIEAVRP